METNYESLDTTPLGGKPTSTPARTLKLLLILVTILALLATSFSIVSMIYSLKINDKVSKGPETLTIEQMPHSFVLGKNFLLPPTDQMNLGTCWSFSLLYQLETQYLDNGIKKGFIKEGEYYRFSEQGYFSYLHKLCTAHTDIPACHYGGILKNSSEDQEVESIIYMSRAQPNLLKSVLPHAVCPYRRKDTETGFDYFYCPKLDDALKKNPIEFKIKSYEPAFNINGAKKLLMKTGRAISIGTPLAELIYYVPCDESPFENSTDCKDKTYVCPDDSTKYCHKINIDSRESDGIFMRRWNVKNIGELGGHAMNVVGFNDDWIYRNRFQANDIKLKGGLILHNSWNSPGHSVEYFLGERSEENEAVLCPNHQAPQNWIPATEECLRNGKPEDCSKDIERIRGDHIASSADLLKCINKEHCDLNATYVLGRVSKETLGGSSDGDVDVQHLSDGLDRTVLYKLKDGDVEKVVIDQFPFWDLSSLFRPVNLVANDPNECGYWIMPYTTLEDTVRTNWDNFDNLRFIDIEVEFTDSSYVAKADPKYDYELLKQSRFDFKRREFDGPVPFDIVYKQ